MIRQLGFCLDGVFGDPRHCGCHAHNGFLTRKGYRALALADGGVDKGVTFQKERVTDLRRDETTMWLSEGDTDEQFRRILEPVEEF